MLTLGVLSSPDSHPYASRAAHRSICILESVLPPLGPQSPTLGHSANLTSLHKRFITLTAATGRRSMACGDQVTSMAEVRDPAWPSGCFLLSLAPTRLCSHSQTTHGGYRAPSINGKAHTGTVLPRPHCVQPGTRGLCTGRFRTCTYVHTGTYLFMPRLAPTKTCVYVPPPHPCKGSMAQHMG